MKIAIAGAFGFVGQNLITDLLESTEHQITALSRTPRSSDNPRIECVTTDLYSLKQANEGLKGCDTAIYLVHSMAPSSRLSQGHFRDFDFLLADNFVRAAKEQGIKQILYVGGMIPEDQDLSLHLKSRLEVEEVLRSYKIPVTTLRCGLVIGPKASSFSIIVRLTERLPAMVLPQWMRTRSNPLYVGDLTKLILSSINDPSNGHRIIDAGMDKAVSYKDIVLETAQVLNKSPALIDVPYVSPHLSKLWVRLVSGASKDLVYPLIDSVRHEMLSNPKRPIPKEWGIEPTDLQSAIKQSLNSPTKVSPPRMLSSIRNLSEVRSIQRMTLPPNKSATEVATNYTHWLPLFLRPFIRVRHIADGCEYCVRGLGLVLLTLKKDPIASQERRPLFRVGQGLLVGNHNKGRFEFRESPDRSFLIVALHNFHPALPWPIYRWTQAQIHKVVMSRFSRFLLGDS